MKKAITILVICWSTSSFAQTSVYHEFPDSNAVWNFEYGQYCMSWPVNGTAYAEYSITISGDTLIGAQNYQKLFTPYVDSTSTGNCGIPVVSGYQGAIREDIPNRKVFYVAQDSLNEVLLYDFNLQVGDTVFGQTQMGWNNDVVLELDSVLIGADYRKRWKINPWYNIYIIEGIGCTYGYFVQSPSNIMDAPGYDLLCFSQDDVTLYPPGTVCELILSIQHPLSPGIALYPNPASDHLKLSYFNFKPKAIRLHSLSGALTREYAADRTYLDLKEIVSGIYFIEVVDEHRNIYREKLVIIN